MNVPELNTALLKMLDSLSLVVPHIDIGSVFQETGDVECGRGSFGDIGGEGEELTCTLCTKYNSHQANEKLDNSVFSRRQQCASIPKQESLNLAPTS